MLYIGYNLSRSNLKSKIQNIDACIAIIGLGYVGLPLSISFSKRGFKTIGFDIDEVKVQKLNSSTSYIQHISKEDISAMVNQGFTATTNFSKISIVDAIIICVPTPLGAHNEPNLSYIINTLHSIKPYLRENQLLVLESTSYPGTTDEILVPFINSIQNQETKIKNKKFTLGVNFYIGYSPEREDPGNKNFTTKTIPKIVSGYTKKCLEATKALYDQIVDVTVPVSSLRVAEMTKILENIHRAVNIGLVNELKMVTDKMNIDIYEVIKAAATKPFGFTPYYPGPGLGGHCIPIDPFFLTWKAKEVGMNTRFIELAGETNAGMPAYVVQKASEALNAVSKSIKGSKILVLGLAYKKNVDDLRDSPSLEIMNNLIKMGAILDYCDSFIKTIPVTRKHQFKLKSKVLNAETLRSADLVLLATDHDYFNYSLIQKEAKLIIDTRGRFKNSEKVVKA